MRHLYKRINVAAALLGLVGAVNAAETSLLPLESGTYTLAGYQPCDTAPFAGVAMFDGRAFSGPHASHCTSDVLDHHDGSYEVSTECRALGDGTPAAPTTVVMQLRVVSPTHYVLLGNGEQRDYERCPAWR